jgi:hypothetical protein
MAALRMTNGKTVFIYYLSAALFALGKSREALLQLEKAITTAPRLLKKFIQLNPAILRNRQVVDLIAEYKQRKSI